MLHDQNIFVCSMKSVISTYKLPNNAILGNNKEESFREYITQIVSANFSLFVNKFDAGCLASKCIINFMPDMN